MKHWLLAIAAVLSAGCHRDDEVTTHYATIAEARAQGAFERGWLPPVLPDSTRNLTERNDLDLNMGDGSFNFAPSDYAPLARRLTPASAEASKGDWQSYTAKGFVIFTFANETTDWTIALHPQGRGFYRVKLRR